MCSDQGPDFRKVVMVRNAGVRTKQNLSTAHDFIVCYFQNIYEFRGHYLAGIFVAFSRFRRYLLTLRLLHGRVGDSTTVVNSLSLQMSELVEDAIAS